MSDDMDKKKLDFARAWMDFLKNFLTVSGYAVGAAVVVRRSEWFAGSALLTTAAASTLYFTSLFASTTTGRLFATAVAARFDWQPHMVRSLLFDLFLIALGTTVAVVAFNSVH